MEREFPGCPMSHFISGAVRCVLIETGLIDLATLHIIENIHLRFFYLHSHVLLRFKKDTSWIMLWLLFKPYHTIPMDMHYFSQRRNSGSHEGLFVATFNVHIVHTASELHRTEFSQSIICWLWHALMLVHVILKSDVPLHISSVSLLFIQCRMSNVQCPMESFFNAQLCGLFITLYDIEFRNTENKVLGIHPCFLGMDFPFHSSLLYLFLLYSFIKFWLDYKYK